MREAVHLRRAPAMRLGRDRADADDVGPRAVAEGDADLGIASALPRRPELRQVALARVRLGAILAASFDHPMIVAALG